MRIGSRRSPPVARRARRQRRRARRRLHPHKRQLPLGGRQLDGRLRAAQRALGPVRPSAACEGGGRGRPRLRRPNLHRGTALRAACPVRGADRHDRRRVARPRRARRLDRARGARIGNERRDGVRGSPAFDPGRADLWPGDSRGGIRRDGAASHLAFGLGSHFCAGYKLSRLEAREGLVRLFRDRRPALAEPLPPLRMHQYHLTVPRLRVTLAQGGSAMTDNPKYRALWPPYQSIPYRPGEEPRPALLRAADHRFDAWAPAPGNATPSWTWVSTPHINAGMFVVPAGCWFDPGDHPNPEPYYIVKGTLHLSNPDTSDVVELHAGDAAEHPGLGLPPRLQLRRRGLLHRLVGARRDAHRPVQAEGRERHALRARVVRAQARWC